MKTFAPPQPAVLVGCLLLALCARATLAQSKGDPGKFDFYLLNLSWSPEFCSIQGTSPECAARPGFIVHGLWPQNDNGSYPVFCSRAPGPLHPAQNLDITPDLSLLAHEWSKHGTCTGLSPSVFFSIEHKAFHSIVVPPVFNHLDHEIMLKPAEILGLFAASNPEFPRGSILVSCGNNRLTAIEACFTKDGLEPMVCQGLHECRAQVVRITPETARAH